MNLSPDGGATPAPRTEGDVDAMNAAYTSGMEFQGDIDIPVIDWRHYLEDELDMHHTPRSRSPPASACSTPTATPATRSSGSPTPGPRVAFDQTPMAFEVIDEWMANIAANPERSVARNQPGAGRRLVLRHRRLRSSPRARRVWDGVLDDAARRAPARSSSRSTRRRAGRPAAPYEGGVWKCAAAVRRPTRIDDGVYGDWEPDAAQRARLEQIFPDGVCDWRRPDVGRPAGDE